MTNCTVSGNSGDGLFIGASLNAAGGTANLTNCTVSGNSSGGLTAQYSIEGGGGTANLNNTIIAAQTGGLDINTLTPGDGVVSGNNNLIGDGSGQFDLENGVDGNQVGTTANPINPLLGPLAPNGGPTETMALLPGSPAIDAGDSALAVDANGKPLTTDQRGTPFARISGAAVDIGAFEVQPNPGPTLSSDQAAVTVNEGSTAVNTGTFDDESRTTVTLTASLGTVITNGAGGTWSWVDTQTGVAGGPTTVTISATDAAGLKATTTFNLTVTASENALPVLSPTLPDGTYGSAYIQPIAVTDTGGAGRHIPSPSRADHYPRV